MRSASRARLAAARTVDGAGVDGCPADMSITNCPACLRFTTASMTRMTWNGGTLPLAAMRATGFTPATLPSLAIVERDPVVQLRERLVRDVDAERGAQEVPPVG